MRFCSFDHLFKTGDLEQLLFFKFIFDRDVHLFDGKGQLPTFDDSSVTMT